MCVPSYASTFLTPPTERCMPHRDDAAPPLLPMILSLVCLQRERRIPQGSPPGSFCLLFSPRHSRCLLYSRNKSSELFYSSSNRSSSERRPSFAPLLKPTAAFRTPDLASACLRFATAIDIPRPFQKSRSSHSQTSSLRLAFLQSK